MSLSSELAEAGELWRRLPLEELRALRSWVVDATLDGRPVLRCQRCGCRQPVLYVGDEDQFRSFSLSHSLCVRQGAGGAPERSTVSRAVPRPGTAAVPSPRPQRASWHTPPAPRAAPRGRRDIDDTDDEGGGW
jgi:hypothetical protein